MRSARFLACLLAICWPVAAEPEQPVIVVPCTVAEVYDGDTVTVRLTLDARIRLLDCWVPEVKAADKAEKLKGIASRDHLRTLAPTDSEALLTIPLTGDRLDDVITMGRVLGRVSIGGKDLSAQQVESGFATKEKLK